MRIALVRFLLSWVGMRQLPCLLVLTVLVGLGCGDGRDSQGVSGSGGLSAGASGGTSEGGSTGAAESTSAASGSATTGDMPTPSTTSTPEDTTGADETTGVGGDETGDTTTGAGDESSSTGASSDSSGIVDGVLEIGIVAHNDCTFTVEPASITVPEGTEFTVNWVSSPASEVEFDIAKIDPFNQVPIVIGMEPGTAYHDDIREWCGTLFTGTFDFRLTSCFDPLYIPVDCGG